MFPVVLLAFLLLPAVADAGTIQLSVATRIVPGAAALRVEIDLRNSGDEAALNVVPSVEFQGRVLAGAALASLEPSVPQTVAIDVSYAGTAPPRGRWPVLVRVAHADGAGRPFEAIHVDVARFGDAGEPPVRLEMADARVESETQVRMRIERGDVGGPIRLAFATPAGIVVTPRVVTHEMGTPADIPITLAATGATATSRLPLVAIAEYDTADGHETVTAIAMIDIGPSTDGARWQVIGLLVGIAAVGGAVIMVRTRKRRDRQDS